MSGEAAIVVAKLQKSYGNEQALAGIDLQVQRGEIYGFLGPNGAGKSTLIQILTTLMLPTAGEASVAGHDVVRRPDAVRRQIGVALQDTGIDPMLTAKELLVLQGRLFGHSKTDALHRATELLKQFGLHDVGSKRVKTYSGGMRRRLDLAIALVHRPQILFLDEPTTGLDPTNRMLLWDLLRQVQERTGVTVFLTTQYLEEADALCNRIGIINRGQIIAEDTPAGLKRLLNRDVIELAPVAVEDVPKLAEHLQTVYEANVVGNTVHVFTPHGASAVADVLEAVKVQKIELASLRVAPPSLDDVFMELTGGGSQDVVAGN